MRKGRKEGRREEGREGREEREGREGRKGNEGKRGKRKSEEVRKRGTELHVIVGILNSSLQVVII